MAVTVEPIKRLQAAVDQTHGIVAGTRTDQLELATPCTEWNVRALLNHTIGVLAMFRDVAVDGAGHMGPLANDLIGDDPVASFARVANETIAAWSAEGRMAQGANMPWGDMPADIALQMLANDVIVHGWDLAKATGQQVGWDQSLAEDSLAFVDPLFTPELTGDAYAPPVPVAADADAMARLVARQGRTP